MYMKRGIASYPKQFQTLQALARHNRHRLHLRQKGYLRGRDAPRERKGHDFWSTRQQVSIQINQKEQTIIKLMFTVIAPCFLLLHSGGGGGARCAKSRLDDFRMLCLDCLHLKLSF